MKPIQKKKELSEYDKVGGRLIIYHRIQKDVDGWRKQYGDTMMRIVMYHKASWWNNPTFNIRKLEEQRDHYLGKVVAGEEILDKLKIEFGLGNIGI